MSDMTLQERIQYAEIMEAKPSGVFARMEKARAYGFDPAHYDEVIDAQKRGNDIILTLSGKAHGALVKSSGRYDYRILTSTEDLCEIEFTDNGEKPFVEKMTRKQADQAGYSKGFAWKTMPLLMLFYRTLTQGVRRYCPDVLGGADGYTPEELEAFGFTRVDSEESVQVAQPAPAPQVETIVINGEAVEAEEIPGWDDIDTSKVDMTPLPDKIQKVLSWCEDASDTRELSLKALEHIMMHHNITEGSAAFDNLFASEDLEGRKRLVLEIFDAGEIPTRYLGGHVG